MKIRTSGKRQILLKNGISSGNIFSFDSLWAYHPRIIKKNSQYYLFYTGKNIKRGISHSIGFAKSKSVFGRYKKNTHPILSSSQNDTWDNDFSAHPFIFTDKNKYYLLYDGSKKGLWKESIGLLSSEDLESWKKNPTPIFQPLKSGWDSSHVSRASLYKIKSEYYLFYTGHNGVFEQIGLAKGKSINTLKRVTSTPLIPIGEKGEWDEINVADPCLIRYKNMFLCFYSGIDKSLKEHIGVAYSKDLLIWEKYDFNPILSPSHNGWDKDGATRFDILRSKNSYTIIYSGKRFKLWNIGYTKLFIT